MPYTEAKWENRIDRITGKAKDPRQIERVPAGVKFRVEFIINVWDDDIEREQEMINLLKEGLRLLQEDYLGGSGSRGYGQIKFGILEYRNCTKENNWKGEEHPSKIEL